jgi:anti-anti-sigma factor
MTPPAARFGWPRDSRSPDCSSREQDAEVAKAGIDGLLDALEDRAQLAAGVMSFGNVLLAARRGTDTWGPAARRIMQITTEIVDGVLELRARGRLDNEAADDLLAVVDDVLRKGHHAALADLREVDYLSSAGIGALMRAQKQFQAIQGIFGVSHSSPQVAEILRLTKLGKLLVCNPVEVRARYGWGASTVQPAFQLAADGLKLAAYALQPADHLTCRIWGDPAHLTANGGAARRPEPLTFPAESFGLGIGAFGRDAADSAPRLGEFVAIAGSVAVQPTPEGGKPDYQLASEGFVPQPHVLYGLSFSGPFSQMIRFETLEGESPGELSGLVDRCLAQSNVRLAGMIFIAETAGLVGARLRRSPAASDTPATFRHPAVRQWFSFAAEHVFPHSLVVAVGVAGRGIPNGDAAPLAPFVRKLSPHLDLFGHFHAAVFSYRPLKKRRLDLRETVQGLFESEDLQGVLHLLHDDRAITGSGESLLVAGACWVGSIARVTREDAR